MKDNRPLAVVDTALSGETLTSATPLTFSPPALVPDYRWITARGEHLRPSVMSTRHLFNAFRMLFNHFSGREQGRFSRKAFNREIFTPAYIELSLYALAGELSTRTLTAGQAAQLREMYEALSRSLLEGATE